MGHAFGVEPLPHRKCNFIEAQGNALGECMHEIRSL